MVDKEKDVPNYARDFFSSGGRRRRSVSFSYTGRKLVRQDGAVEAAGEAFSAVGRSPVLLAPAKVSSSRPSNRYNCPEPRTRDVHFVETVLVCECCDGGCRRVYLRKEKWYCLPCLKASIKHDGGRPEAVGAASWTAEGVRQSSGVRPIDTELASALLARGKGTL